ncbi:MAG: fibronectin type III domain-containing protein [Saprospiraceae bacterium]|nr:fibronectin type III domain-containing protein [Saprospiraceae bacterium]
MSAFIATNLDGYSDGNFTIAVNNISVGMTGNLDFPNPPHKMSDVNDVFSQYKSASKERSMMSPNDTKKRNELRKKLAKMLRVNGMYVISLFPDNEEKQLSSQYPPVKSKNDSGEPDAPSRLKAVNGSNSGEASLSFRGSSIAKGYNIRYRIKNSTEAWTYKPVSKSRGITIAGLKPGEVYEFWAQALGAKKDSDFGGPAELRII